MFKTARAAALVIATLIGLAFQADALPQTFESTLPNGLRVIMIPDSRAEMVASYVIVNAAVRYETPEINGVTHLLEHMLFNGTDKLTQEELYAETDRLGAFNNAFTRKDFTAFMMLAPSYTFAKAFELQADMLLHSTLPPEKMEKERGIIIEEINQGMGSPDEAVADAMQRILWNGMPYEMTVLGPKKVISSVSRDAVVKYYKSHYAPNGMTILLLGDFVPEEMMALIQAKYGGAMPQSAPKADVAFKPAKPGMSTQYFSRITPSVSFAVLLPELSQEASVALSLGGELLRERLSKAFTDLAGHDVAVSIGEDVYLEGGYLTGTIGAQDEKEAKAFARALPAALTAATSAPDEAWLTRKRREMLARELKDYDNFLFFGMTKAPFIAQGKWELARNAASLVEGITGGQISDELVRLNMGTKVTILIALPYPEAKATSKAEASSKRVVLANGVTLLVKSDPRSQVFGASVVFRNRNFAEPIGRCGMAELWQRTLMQGPVGMTKDDFGNKLAGLGLTMDFVDNPYIPMDDMYLSARYSFIKAEGLDESWRDNIALLADTVAHPKMDDAALADAKRSLMQVLGMKSAGTRDRARSLYLGGILGDTPMAKPVEGIAREAGMATLDELKSFAKSYAGGGNVIVSIATSAPLDEVVRAATEEFSALPSGDAVVALAPKPQQGTDVMEGEGAPQATIYFGYAFDGLDDADRAALIIFGGIIGDHSAFVIREQQGLAYSVGAGFDNFGGVGWFTLSMGTSPENIDKAKDCIHATLNGLTTTEITADEVERGVNSLVGRRIMRRITRKNQAFFAATSELNGEADSALDEALKRVTLDDVLRVREKYYHPEMGTFTIVK